MKDKHNHDIESNEIHHFGRFTIVALKDKTGIRAVGVARKSDLDTSNPTLGEEIAKGRADRALALKKKGRGVRHILMG